MQCGARLLVLVTLFHSLGCSLLAGRATDEPSFHNQSNGSALSQAIDTQVGQRPAPIVASSTARLTSEGMTVQQLRAERDEQNEQRRQRDQRFAEVQREIGERLRQQQEELLNATRLSSRPDRSSNVIPASATVVSSQSSGVRQNSTSELRKLDQAAQALLSVKHDRSRELDDVTVDSIESSMIESLETNEKSESNPQRWLIILLVALTLGTIVAWPLTRGRNEYSNESQRDQPENSSDSHDAAQTPLEPIQFVSSSDLESASCEEVTSASDNVTPNTAEYSVNCVATWEEAIWHEARSNSTFIRPIVAIDADNIVVNIECDCSQAAECNQELDNSSSQFDSAEQTASIAQVAKETMNGESTYDEPISSESTDFEVAQQQHCYCEFTSILPPLTETNCESQFVGTCVELNIEDHNKAVWIDLVDSQTDFAEITYPESILTSDAPVGFESDSIKSDLGAATHVNGTDNPSAVAKIETRTVCLIRLPAPKVMTNRVDAVCKFALVPLRCLQFRTQKLPSQLRPQTLARLSPQLPRLESRTLRTLALLKLPNKPRRSASRQLIFARPRFAVNSTGANSSNSTTLIVHPAARSPFADSTKCQHNLPVLSPRSAKGFVVLFDSENPSCQENRVMLVESFELKQGELKARVVVPN